jgi:hypothetical protein
MPKDKGGMMRGSVPLIIPPFILYVFNSSYCPPFVPLKS